MSDSEWISVLAKIQRSLKIEASIIPDDLLRDIDAALRSAEKRLRVYGETLEDERVLDKLVRATWKLEHYSEAKMVPELVAANPLEAI